MVKWRNRPKRRYLKLGEVLDKSAWCELSLITELVQEDRALVFWPSCPTFGWSLGQPLHWPIWSSQIVYYWQFHFDYCSCACKSNFLSTLAGRLAIVDIINLVRSPCSCFRLCLDFGFQLILQCNADLFYCNQFWHIFYPFLLLIDFFYFLIILYPFVLNVKILMYWSLFMYVILKYFI